MKGFRPVAPACRMFMAFACSGFFVGFIMDKNFIRDVTYIKGIWYRRKTYIYQDATTLIYQRKFCLNLIGILGVTQCFIILQLALKLLHIN